MRPLALALSALVSACLAPGPTREQATPTEAPDVRIHRAQSPSSSERYCAWFGEASGDVLYFGEAAFWSAMRTRANDPRADLEQTGPRRIGRFDLVAGRLLPALDAGSRIDGSEPRSGVWDVLPVEGRVYFTTFFEEAGFVELETGAVTLLPDADGWNELALGPTLRRGPSSEPVQLILVTRYADARSGGGAVVIFDADGGLVAELPLAAPSGSVLAPKTPAWDPIEREIWVTTDLLPLPPRDDENTPFAHPTVVLDLAGREVARFGSPDDPIEIQTARFDAHGRGHLAVADGTRLELVVLEPRSSRRDLAAARRVLLDDAFAPDFDFAQDIQIGSDGSAYVARWSGRVHRVHRDGRVETWQLPRAADALYYSAVPAGSTGRICATRCGDVEIVCAGPGTAAEP